MAGNLHRDINRMLRPFRLKIGDIPIWLAGLFISLLWAAPFVWMVSTSLKPADEVMTVNIEWIPRHVTFENYRRIFAEFPLLQWAINSLVVSVVGTGLGVLFGAMAGYALARLRFPGRDALFALFIASLMIPADISVVPLLLAMIKIHWINSYRALIAPTIGNVFSVYIFRQFFLKFPADLEDAAKMDGANTFLIFWRIAFPLARAPMIATTVILFTLNWNSFLWPLLVTFDDSMKTLPVGIAAFTPELGTHTQLEGFALGMAGVTILSLPCLLLFFALQRYFIQGIASGAIRG